MPCSTTFLPGHSQNPYIVGLKTFSRLGDLSPPPALLNLVKVFKQISVGIVFCFFRDPAEDVEVISSREYHLVASSENLL